MSDWIASSTVGFGCASMDSAGGAVSSGGVGAAVFLALMKRSSRWGWG